MNKVTNFGYVLVTIFHIVPANFPNDLTDGFGVTYNLDFFFFFFLCNNGIFRNVKKHVKTSCGF